MRDSNARAVPETAGEVRLRKPERRQMAWVPQCPDDWVPSRHGVRTVAEVVAKLDLSAFREAIRAREGVAGRDATDPELLVALWLYACIRGIGSARELARRCEESAPFRWLCGGVSVNHRMLSDFRTDHGAALDQLFTQVIASLVEQHLLDGGYLRNRDIERAHEQGVELFVPPKGARTAKNRGRELQPQQRDSAAMRAWKQRMASEEGQKIYRQRASTSETINADLRTYRGLTQLTVRGLHKARCVALWCALAYNVMHFSAALLK